MISCSPRMAWSTRASVEKPVLPRRFLDSPSLVNSTSASCWGEPMVNSSPASIHTSRSSALASSSTRLAIARTVSTSSFTPARSISTSTSTSGSSISCSSRVSPSASSRSRWRSASTRVTTASAATPSPSPSTSAPMPSSLGQLLQRVAAPSGVDQVGGEHGVVLELHVALEALGGGDGLPVVRHQRPVADGQRHGRERLGLPDQHLLAAAVRREAKRLARRRPGAARPPAAPRARRGGRRA